MMVSKSAEVLPVAGNDMSKGDWSTKMRTAAQVLAEHYLL